MDKLTDEQLEMLVVALESDEFKDSVKRAMEDLRAGRIVSICPDTGHGTVREEDERPEPKKKS